MNTNVSIKADQLSIDNPVSQATLAEVQAIISEANFAQQSEQALAKTCGNLRAEIQVLTHGLRTSLAMRALLVRQYEEAFNLLNDRSLAEGATGTIDAEFDEAGPSSSRKGKGKAVASSSQSMLIDF
jgi:hypothetical protein